MKTETTIYILNDPIVGIPRYIGITTGTIKHRLVQHISESIKLRYNKKHKWIVDLVENKNLLPVIEVLEEITTNNRKEVEEIELYWIQQFKSWGFDLLNSFGNNYKNTPKEGNGTKIAQYNLDGNFIKLFLFVREAAAAVTTSEGDSLIHRAARNKNGAKAFGYQWRYFIDITDNIGKAKSKFRPNEKRKVYQFSVDGNFICEWECGQTAAKVLGLHKSKISNCCNGKRKTHGGYLWSFNKG